jgi:5-methylcytosine-specific restriction endonuclease McrA
MGRIRERKIIDGITHVICSRCRGFFPETEEYFVMDKRNGKSKSDCKKCCNEKRLSESREHLNELARARYARLREKELERFRIYRAENKGKVNKSVRLYKSKNMDSIRKQQKIKRNTDEYRLKSRIYNHRRRAREGHLLHDITENEWENCKDYFEQKCAYCGSEEELQQEHFIPVVRGGGYTIGNIIPACKRCNSSKNDSAFEQWYRRQDYYSAERESKVYEYLCTTIKVSLGRQFMKSTSDNYEVGDKVIFMVECSVRSIYKYNCEECGKTEATSMIGLSVDAVAGIGR